MTTETQNTWAVVYDQDGSTVLGIARELLSMRVTKPVGQIGSFDFVVPATEPVASLMEISGYVDLYYGLSENNPRMRGRIDELTYMVTEDGANGLRVSGYSLGVELRDAKTYFGVVIDDDTVANTMDALLEGTGWTDVVTGSGFVNLTQRFDNMSIWQAMTWLAEHQGAYLRETATSRQVEIKRGTAASGIVLRNADALEPGVLSDSRKAGWIRRIGRVRKDGGKIVNRIVPIGEDAGNIVYDLGNSDRASPYTIQSFVKNRPSIVHALLSDTESISLTTVDNTYNIQIVTDFRVSGKNRVVLVALCIEEPAEATLQDVRVGGVPLESYGSSVTGGADVIMYFMIGKGIPEGSHIVEVNLRAVSASNVAVRAICISLQDVDQSETYLDDGDEGSGTTASAPTPAASADALRIAVLTAETGFTATSGANQTEIVKGSTGLPMAADFMTSDADETASWSFSASEVWAIRTIKFPGAVTYYIEDSTSKTAHGGPNTIPRTEMMIEPADKLVGATDDQLEAAANTLYDLAAARLAKLKDPLTFFEDVDVTDIADDWLPGDSMRLIYVGSVEEEHGRRGWLNLDETLYVLEATEQYDGDGVRSWRLTLATDYEWPLNDGELLAEQERRLAALEGK